MARFRYCGNAIYVSEVKQLRRRTISMPMIYAALLACIADASTDPGSQRLLKKFEEIEEASKKADTATPEGAKPDGNGLSEAEAELIKKVRMVFDLNNTDDALAHRLLRSIAADAGVDLLKMASKMGSVKARNMIVSN